jgi:hypothetical protein
LLPQLEETIALDTFIDEMLENKYIQMVNTSALSNIILERKPNQALRICLNYKFLNKKTKEDIYPMHKVASILERIGGFKI